MLGVEVDAGPGAFHIDELHAAFTERDYVADFIRAFGERPGRLASHKVEMRCLTADDGTQRHDTGVPAADLQNDHVIDNQGSRGDSPIGHADRILRCSPSTAFSLQSDRFAEIAAAYEWDYGYKIANEP